MEKFKNWMSESANILFDDSKNDLRALPKSVRLQILLVLSFIWTTVFTGIITMFGLVYIIPYFSQMLLSYWAMFFDRLRQL